ncbi:FAS1-like dehydratase domain-containing protein [Parasulfitobacter algicola]|uniref:Acyl dehydratase n=1 Tax=Parasulfitobacter algicola TaxID=2614809 RepID=A0ABX2IN61_9RHOB|nr:MaoC family dehydratase N-terminal domain-containing protein [Sulfitobacter algicola]NSX53985.1 acyl dehydratase [Sulfitobacter algicola]
MSENSAVGQFKTQSDIMDPARGAALLTVLGQDGNIRAGDALPPFFHQAYFWDVQAQDDLGRDGHPGLGGFIPNLDLPRRMWAGGRIEFKRPLIAGMPAEKRVTIENITRKTGRSGPLGFVTLRHEIWQGEALCVTERQDLVYRNDPTERDAQIDPPPAPDGHIVDRVNFGPTQLFRYSALTFNGHRIHYDLDYCRKVEGYAGLVVHGPLLAQHLILMCQAKLGALSSFDFRATAPLLDFETAQMGWKDGKAWIKGPDERLCMTARATS